MTEEDNQVSSEVQEQAAPDLLKLDPKTVVYWNDDDDGKSGSQSVKAAARSS